MRTTSVALARVAHALQAAGLADHGELVNRADELAIAAAARDQLYAGLVQIHGHLFAAFEPSVHRGVMDVLRHPVLGLGTTLATRVATGLHGPSPTELAITPPRTAAARAWVNAAAALEPAVVDAHRADSDRPYAAWMWAFATGGPNDPDPATPPAIAWALVADLAAIAAVTADLDRDLGTALTSFPDPGVAAAGHRMLALSVADVAITARQVLSLAQSGPLPGAYHLRTPATRAALVRSIDAVPTAMDRTIELLRTAPTLNRMQVKAVSTSIASIAHHLSIGVDPTLRKALQQLAMSAASLAAVWDVAKIAAISEGSWEPAIQARNIARILEHPPAPTTDRASGLEPPGAALERLPGLVRSLTANTGYGFSTHRYLTPDPHGPTGTGWETATFHPARRAIQDVTAAVEAAGDQVGVLAGRPRPVAAVTGQVTGAPARDVLRDRLTPVRPEHPALPLIKRTVPPTGAAARPRPRGR